MENLILSFEVVGPLFLMMVIGYALRRSPMLDEHTVVNGNKLVFRLFLPTMLFQNIYEGDLSGIANPALLSLTAGGLFLTYLITYLLVPRFVKDNPRRGVMVQGISRSNMSLFGVPMAVALYGEGNIALVASVMAITLPLTNTCSVLALELSRGGRPQWGHILKSIVTNPIIIGVMLGLCLNLCSVTLPNVLRTAVKSLGAVASPLSFVLLGASFTFRAAAKNRTALCVASLSRLFLVPLCFLSLGVLIGLREQALFAALVVFAPPTAVSSFPMAQAMGGDGELANEIVVFTSLFSVVSMFFWVFLLKHLTLL